MCVRGSEGKKVVGRKYDFLDRREREKDTCNANAKHIHNLKHCLAVVNDFEETFVSHFLFLHFVFLFPMPQMTLSINILLLLFFFF